MNIQAPKQLFAYTSSVRVCDLCALYNSTFWLHMDRACSW